MRYDFQKSASFRDSPSHVRTLQNTRRSRAFVAFVQASGELTVPHRLAQVVAEHEFVSGDVVTAEAKGRIFASSALCCRAGL